MTMDQEPDEDYMAPPPGVDPHEGRELDLMLRGIKPLAYFSGPADRVGLFPDTEFAPHVQSGRIVMQEYAKTRMLHGKARAYRDLFYALPSEPGRIDALRTILSRSDTAWTVECDREIGRLLGYSEADIEAFIDHEARVEAAFRAGHWSRWPPADIRTANADIPGLDGVAPHEGRELDLMLRGIKPLAYFSEPVRTEFELPDAVFDPFVAVGRLVKGDFVETIRGEDIRFLWYALPEEKWRIEKAHAFCVAQAGRRTETEEDAYTLGRLLGYSDNSIARYVEQAGYVVRTP